MQNNHSEPKADAVEMILKEKFGKLHFWTMPIIRKTVGPYTPEVFSRFASRRTKLIEECKQVLDSSETAEMIEQVHSEDKDMELRALEWEEFLRPEINALIHQMPNWMSGGFGHPDYVADFEYWGQMAEFKLHEALLLSVGIEPRYVDERVIDSAAKKIGQNNLIPAIEYLAKRREQFRRHFPSGYNDWYAISPRALKSWFDEISLDVYPDFYAQLDRRFPNALTKVESGPEKEISQQERETLLKLIAAMACEQYNYDPNEIRNSVTSSVRDDIHAVGLSMDPKTIRK